MNLKNELENTFKIVRITSSSYKDYIKCLEIYNNTTPIEIKTDTNQITEWINTDLSNFGFDLFFFALYVNGEIAGFAMLTHLKKSNVVLYEYMSFKQEYRTNTIFFAFVDLIEGYIDMQCLHINGYIVEISNRSNGNNIDKESKFFKQVICLQGFTKINVGYETLQIGESNYESSFDAFIYIKQKNTSIEMNKKTYISLLSELYLDYTCEWFKVDHKMTNYREYVKNAYEKLGKVEENLKNIETIAIIGPTCNLMADQADLSYIANTPLKKATISNNKYFKLIIAIVFVLFLTLIMGKVLELIGLNSSTLKDIITSLSALIPALLYFEKTN